MRSQLIRPLGWRLAASGAIALAGIALSGYLLYIRWTGGKIYCTSSGGCETVQTSEYATVAGLPVALFGLLLYLAVVAGVGVSASQIRLRWLVPALFAVALAGTLYSAYLTYLELWVIEAICAWCVTSAGMVTLIAVLLGVETVLSADSLDASGGT